MTIAKKFVVLTFLTLVSFITVNFFALQFYTSKHFLSYLQTIESEVRAEKKKILDETQRQKNIGKLEGNILDTLLRYPNVTPEVIAQVKKAHEDLQTITSTLEEYVENNVKINQKGLEKYLLSRGISAEEARKVNETNGLSIFLQSTPLQLFTGEKSAEKTFVIKVLSAMLWVNLVLLLLVLVIVYIYTRRSFAPIQKVTQNLEYLTQFLRYQKIHYDKNDEFGVLINSINNLGKKLASQEKIRSQFLADMSHELRTPMTAIQVYLEGISDGVIQPNSENIQGLVGEIHRLKKIVESMLKYQKFEQKNIEFSYGWIDFEELVQNTLRYYERQLKEAHQSVNLEVGIGRIWFDADATVQVVHNIVSNFLKYAGAEAQLKISVFEEGGFWSLVFEDDGLGVAKDKVPFLTEKFYQVDSARTGTQSERGMGLGLSIVDKIVHAAWGLLDIWSEKWKGLRIRIDLPKPEKNYWHGN